MRIALVLTPFDQLGSAGFKTGKTKRVYGYSMPLGIAYIAAVLKNAGHSVEVLDPCPTGLSISAVAEWVSSVNPDVLGISAMTHVAASAYKLASEVKARRSNLPIILGGSHCTVFPEIVLNECPNIDVVVIGEAEDRITRLFDVFRGAGALSEIPGIIYRDKNTKAPVMTGAPQVIKNLDEVPFPARSLFDNKQYLPFPDQIRKTPVTNLMTSRGCTWRKCKFCFEGGKYMPCYRRRTPENVVTELKEVAGMGFGGVAIWDDNFCAGNKWVDDFCRLVAENKLNLTWTCCGRVDTVNEKMLRSMRRAGCFSIYFGFESGNDEMLKLISKGTTTEQARRAVGWCRAAGLEVRGSFILGLPGDTPELAMETIAFARELCLDSVKFMLYTPEPGTALYDIAMKEGQVIERSWQGSGSLTRATYLSKGYASVDQLENIARDANRSYMLRWSFIWRKLLSVRSFSDIRKYMDGLVMVLSLGGRNSHEET